MNAWNTFSQTHHCLPIGCGNEEADTRGGGATAWNARRNVRRHRGREMRGDAMDAEMVVGTTTHVYDETLAREIASECATSGHGRKAIEKGVREIEAALKGAKEASR